MKKVYVLLVVSMILLMPILGLRTARAQEDRSLKLTEIYYNTGPGCEFLKIENWGEESLFQDIAVTNGKSTLHLPEFRLESDEALVIAQDEKYGEIWDREADLLWSNESQVETEGNFDLYSTGGEVILKVNDEPIDSFYYGDGDGKKLWKGEPVKKLPKGGYARRKEIDTDSKEDWTWDRTWKVGHSDFEAEEIRYNGKAVTYSAPDSSLDSLLNFIEGTDSSLKIAVYQLESLKIAEEVVSLSHEGVEVKVLVDASPVGGRSEAGHYSLSWIEESGAEVQTIGDGYSPYRFFHCKYIIRDNSSVLISSENFGDTGYPSVKKNGNRGWGIILEDKNVTGYYDRVYRGDWRFSEDYRRREVELETDSKEYGSYDPRFESEELHGDFVIRPLLSPDTSMSEKTLLGMINSAENSIFVQQFYIDRWEGKENPYLTALKEAALRGIEVKVLLDSTWYNIEEDSYGNDDVVEDINEFAEEKEVDIEARLLSSYHGLIKSHNKGMVVDEDKAMISSINWNANSPLQNREVGVIVQNDKVGQYYTKIFEADWKDTIDPIADAGLDRNVNLGEKLEVYGGNSWDDHRITEYRWDVDGDGTYDESGKKISLTFEEEGRYEVKLHVNDVDGNADTDTVMVEVERKEDANKARYLDWVILVTPMTGIILLLVNKRFLNRS
ncbi:MAG: PKD domain-containing protein [Candidatus Thermoplasmatota archaeon]|nr:PKD domain-containing protein [Candidatus Thermoplasmatota archaeon]